MPICLKFLTWYRIFEKLKKFFEHECCHPSLLGDYHASPWIAQFNVVVLQYFTLENIEF
jgi:hypothetical protein